MWGIRLKLSQPCRAVHVRWQIAIGNATPYHIAIGNVMWCVSTWMCTYCIRSCVCVHAACGSAWYCLLAREQVFDCIMGNRFLIALSGSWWKCRQEPNADHNPWMPKKPCCVIARLSKCFNRMPARENSSVHNLTMSL